MTSLTTFPARLTQGAVLAAALAGSGCQGPDLPRAAGILEWDRIELPAEASEPIVEFFAAEGDRLEAGQPVVQLDTARTEARRDEAAAGREQAAARLSELKRGPRAERVDQAQARLHGARSNLETARTELERTQSLVARKLATDEALDLARNRRDQALAERDAARAELSELLTGATVEELQQAEAGLRQAEARLRELEITLERLTVRAPREGVLDTLPFKLGAQPRAGEAVAVMLAGQAPYARVYVPEPVRARITRGAPAIVRVDGVEKPFEGRVRMISREAAFTPHYSLTEEDRSRLSYVAEVTLAGQRARELSSGAPLWVEFPAGTDGAP